MVRFNTLYTLLTLRYLFMKVETPYFLIPLNIIFSLQIFPAFLMNLLH